MHKYIAYVNFWSGAMGMMAELDLRPDLYKFGPRTPSSNFQLL